MTCAACAKSVERAVGKLEGIDSVSVTLPQRKLSLNITEAVRLSEIKQAIAKAGYKALEIENKT